MIQLEHPPALEELASDSHDELDRHVRLMPLMGYYDTMDLTSIKKIGSSGVSVRTKVSYHCGESTQVIIWDTRAQNNNEFVIALRSLPWNSEKGNRRVVYLVWEIIQVDRKTGEPVRDRLEGHWLCRMLADVDVQEVSAIQLDRVRAVFATTSLIVRHHRQCPENIIEKTVGLTLSSFPC